MPVFFAEGPPPVRASLVFRVGRVDENISTAGITHLVEHLALFPFGEQPYRYNGAVEGLRTVFSVVGTPTEIGRHFDRLTVSLTRLPQDRTWTEARILRTEAASRKFGVGDKLLGLRYGPGWWGLLNHEEHGLNNPDPSFVQQWAAHWFTSGNAALWISGADIPPLSLDLPEGPHTPVPEDPPSRISLPAWLSAPSTIVALSMIVPRSTLVQLLQRVLEKRSRSRLRYEEGVSYEVTSDYLRLSRDLAHLVVCADTLAESAASVANGLLRVLEELATAGPAVDELAVEVARAKELMKQPWMPFYLLDAAVTNELIGSEQYDPSRAMQELQRATPQELATLLARAVDSTIAIVPPGVDLPAPRFTPIPDWYRQWAG